MVISQPPGNNPSYTRHQRCLNCSECFQRHLMFYTCNYNIRVIIEMVLLSIFLHWTRSTEGIISRLFFIHFVAPCFALHPAAKILLQIFLYEDLSTLAYIKTVGCISLQNASRTALCYATNNAIETFLIFDENHQQKHKEVRPDWNDKNDNANYAPSYHMEGFTNGSGCHFLKKYSIKCEKI